MSTLDGSIVNIALPTISANMSVPMNQAEWVVSVYLMVVCACLLLFGKIGDSWGKIKVFRLGMLIFTIGSLLCGFNHSLAFLLFARVVQAIGASMTMATNTGIITEVFPISERRTGTGDDRRFRVARINCWSRTRRDHIVSFFMALYFLDQCSCRNSDYDCRGENFTQRYHHEPQLHR